MPMSPNVVRGRAGERQSATQEDSLRKYVQAVLGDRVARSQWVPMDVKPAVESPDVEVQGPAARPATSRPANRTRVPKLDASPTDIQAVVKAALAALRKEASTDTVLQAKDIVEVALRDLDAKALDEEAAALCLDNLETAPLRPAATPKRAELARVAARRQAQPDRRVEDARRPPEHVGAENSRPASAGPGGKPAWDDRFHVPVARPKAPRLSDPVPPRLVSSGRARNARSVAPKAQTQKGPVRRVPAERGAVARDGGVLRAVRVQEAWHPAAEPRRRADQELPSAGETSGPDSQQGPSKPSDGVGESERPATFAAGGVPADTSPMSAANISAALEELLSRKLGPLTQLEKQVADAVAKLHEVASRVNAGPTKGTEPTPPSPRSEAAQVTTSPATGTAATTPGPAQPGARWAAPALAWRDAQGASSVAVSRQTRPLSTGVRGAGDVWGRPAARPAVDLAQASQRLAEAEALREDIRRRWALRGGAASQGMGLVGARTYGESDDSRHDSTRQRGAQGMLGGPGRTAGTARGDDGGWVAGAGAGHLGGPGRGGGDSEGESDAAAGVRGVERGEVGLRGVRGQRDRRQGGAGARGTLLDEVRSMRWRRVDDAGMRAVAKRAVDLRLSFLRYRRRRDHAMLGPRDASWDLSDPDERWDPAEFTAAVEELADEALEELVEEESGRMQQWMRREAETAVEEAALGRWGPG